MTLATILTARNLRLVDNSGTGDAPSIDRAIPRADARALVQELAAAGVEASDAPDNDDRSLSWVYVGS